MPIYMDIHHVPGVEALNLAEAHTKDMLIEKQYQCKAMTYWVDENRGAAFCLIEAPDKKSVEEMHRNSHGLIPNKIIEVKNEVVESFLGRINDPEDAEILDNGLKVFSDSAFRVILVTDIIDPVLLRHTLGASKATELVNHINSVIREKLTGHGGREVDSAGTGFIASFVSATKAVACALDIQESLSKGEKSSSGFKIGLHGGGPVLKSEKIFGDTIQLARYLCTTAENSQIAISTVVKDLIARENFRKGKSLFKSLSNQDETTVESLFSKLEENWQDSNFAVTELCQSMSMSKSQLYRKTVALWGLAPNLLLKEFRLNKAKELLKKQSYNIAQTTFDSGFTSPSYFTKCFKKKFGLLPANYLSSVS
jgi:AraC-like DNA-binding protein